MPTVREPQWATVKSTSPLEVLVDGAADTGPATAPQGVGLALQQRVLTMLVGRDLIVVGAYQVTAAPAGQVVYLTSPNGSVYRLTVSDAGALGTSGPIT